MSIKFVIKMIVALSILASSSNSAATPNNQITKKFLFIGASDPKEFSTKLTDKVEGVQIVYSWKSLEVKKDSYSFDKIERDLLYLNTNGKKLWIQLQDRFFSATNKSIPSYLQEEEIYQGGLARQKDNPGEGAGVGAGWVTKQWNPHVQLRYQKLIEELAKKFDGKIYGINLAETSADIDIKTESKTGFTCDKYFNATMENINIARSAFAKSHVVQYINFWPCEWDNDHDYMRRFFRNAVEKKIGLGGPDILPHRKGQMKNAYPFFNKYKSDLSMVAFAVQEPTRTYTNPQTKKRFTDEEFLDFGRNYLGAQIIFWSVE